MKKTLGMATLVAGMILAGGKSVEAAPVTPNEALRSGDRIERVQMNSPGDGISSGAARSGNGRKMMRGHRGRHHHHHRHRH